MQLKDRFQRKTTGAQLSKNSLQKYKKINKSDKNQNYKKQASSETLKNQCKKYFIDPNNIYYQDRDSIKKISSAKKLISTLASIWIFLAITYFIINRIKPFQKECPENATCRVFIRCNPGYQLNNDQDKCVIESKIIQRIQNVCKFQIQKLRLSKGNYECYQSQQLQKKFNKRIQDLKTQLTKDNTNSGMVLQIKKKIDQFLNNDENKKLYKFNIEGDYIQPTQKMFTWYCYMKQSNQFKIAIAILLISIIFVGFLFRYIDRANKAFKIYQFLKQKVLNEKKVNITLLGDQMISVFGKIDQNLWTAIDQLRKKDKQIGYFQDEYLYWKLF